MIESIHIKNFRGIQDGKIDKFSKINLLVGPNNSGKSAVLEAIYLSNTNSTATTLERSGSRYEALTASRDLLGFDPLKRICSKHSKQVVDGLTTGSFSKSWQKTGFMLHLPFLKPAENCDIASCGVVSVQEEKDQYQQAPLWEFFKALDLPFSMDGIRGTLTLFWESSLTYYQAKESAWLIKGIKPASNKTLLYDVTTSLAHLPFEYFREMLGVIPGWTHKIAKSFERIFQLKQKYNVTFLQLQHDLSQTQGFIAPEDKVALTIDDYGDGARSAFKLLAPLIALSELATAEEPGVFIWEEPELFQNPQSLGKLLAEVTQLVKDKPIQIFIATHSIEVIGQFVRLVTEKAIAEDELLAIRLNLQDGQLSSSAFNHQDIQDWTAMHLDLRVPDGRVDSPLKFQLAEAANDDE